MERSHTLPSGIGVQQLVPSGSGDILMTPDREVLGINRGDEAYEDMFDSKSYVIQPGFFMTQLGAALHFKARAVVPGTRNPETRSETSFIAIIGAVELRADGTFKVLKAVDDPIEWTSFTAEERADYEGKAEALDREGMVNPIDADVRIVPTSQVLAGHGTRERSPRIRKGNSRTSGRKGTALQVTDPALMEAIPPENNQVLQEAHRAGAMAAAEGHKPDES